MNRTTSVNLLLAFGLVVKGLRQSKGLSQEKLAELAQIHRTYVGDVERGTRNIALLNMAKLASGLAVPLSKLIRETERRIARHPRISH